MSLGNLDRRRVNGPVTSPPVFYTSATASSSSKSKSAAIASPSRTTDLSSARPIFVQTGLVSQASGSAYLESDTIKVACAVYGPRQTKSKTYKEEAELNVDVRSASFATKRRKKAGKDTESASLGDAVRSALMPSLRLDLLPKASIDVFITILEVGASRGRKSKGGEDDDLVCAAAATTIASCALADAGVEMWGLVVGINGVLCKQIQKPVIDPSISEAEEYDVYAAMTLFSMPALGTVTSMDQSGEMSLEELDELMDPLQAASVSIHLNIATALKESYLARQAKTQSITK